MAGPEVEITSSRSAAVGAQSVRRALPRRARRTVGAWCFADHLGPETVDEQHPAGIGPHPHIGLQTVTWLVAGELLHRDSVGSEQVIRPGQLNLMTAGHGVSHAEEATAYRGDFHGIQLWVAQPDSTRHDPPAFEHHRDLPRLELGQATATVLIGELANTSSPARRDTDHLGADLRLRPGRSVLPVAVTHEHAVIVLDGTATIDGRPVTPGHLAYLAPGRDELVITADGPVHLVLIGGEPFEAQPLMWWNFVARGRAEVEAAVREWNDGDDRFGDTGSTWPRIPSPTPVWRPVDPR